MLIQDVMESSRFTILTLLVIVVAGIYYAIQPLLSNYHETTPTVVRIGVLPDVSKTELQRRYNPLLNYLSEETGLDFELVLPADYEELLHLFSVNEVDLALFGGLTFVQARGLYQAEPLVMRDVDRRFTSVFLVRNNEQADELSDLKGRVFAFGSRLSTSGHLMPRYFMQNEKKIIAEKFFAKVEYSGAHDKTAYMVRDGEADVGAVNTEIILGMFRDGRLNEKDLRVVWETPPYPDYVWAVPKHLNENIKTTLRDAFLQLDIIDQHHSTILSGLGARSFLPAGNRIFIPLQQIAVNLELLSSE